MSPTPFPEGQIFTGVLRFKYVYVKGHRTGDVGDHDTYLFHTSYKTSCDMYLYVYNLIETI